MTRVKQDYQERGLHLLNICVLLTWAQSFLLQSPCIAELLFLIQRLCRACWSEWLAGSEHVQPTVRISHWSCKFVCIPRAETPVAFRDNLFKDVYSQIAVESNDGVCPWPKDRHDMFILSSVSASSNRLHIRESLCYLIMRSWIKKQSEGNDDTLATAITVSNTLSFLSDLGGSRLLATSKKLGQVKWIAGT